MLEDKILKWFKKRIKIKIKFKWEYVKVIKFLNLKSIIEVIRELKYIFEIKNK